MTNKQTAQLFTKTFLFVPLSDGSTHSPGCSAMATPTTAPYILILELLALALFLGPCSAVP